MTDTPKTSRDTLRKIAEEHYGPELAELVRIALNSGTTWKWGIEAKALLRKIDEGMVPE